MKRLRPRVERRVRARRTRQRRLDRGKISREDVKDG
jgi:hypothetical protein